MFLNLVLFLSFILSVGLAVNTDNLVALVQIFRHGERTPIHFYKNDPYKDYWVDLDPGQLTNEGRRQLYALGQLTRSRYSDWIPTKYNKNFFHAQTTDVDRTHMSGQSFLYGLFPAVNDQIWLPGVNWQAIPLHPSDPRVVYSSSTLCPAFEDLFTKVLTEDEHFVKINSENAELYAYLTEHSGNNITTIETAAQIYNALKIESGVGLTLPNWTQSVYPEPLRQISGYDFQSVSYNTQLKRFVTGTFFNEIVEYFNIMAKNATSAPKIQVYSAHDTNIASVLNGFGDFDPPYNPEFGATIWIELRNSNDTPFVNVWSKDGDNITQVNINGCSLDCPLDEVQTRLSDLLLDVEKWTAECNASQHLRMMKILKLNNQNN